MKDEENINYLFSLTSTSLLSQILKNKKVDLNYLVKKELANRGQDRDGIFIGFNQAKKLHKIIN